MDAVAQLNSALAGRYDVEREIGAGGMATVYLARDVRHNRKVALKVLKPDLGAVVGTERFLSEIQVTANLQHPNLLPLFDSGHAGELLFYVMPFVEGESLRARLEREGQLPIDEAVHITTILASALDYAHSQGVIHRDLKPENILVLAGQPVIADFGIALALATVGGERITQTGISLGTPQYMSPEQATGDRNIDHRADIYSLGAIAYEMLTGEPPHSGRTAQMILARLITEAPRPARVTRPNVSAHVDAAIMRALEKLPADRFASARDFADALTGKGEAQVVTAGAASPPPGTRLAPESRWRQNLRAGVMVGVLGVVVVGAAYAAIKWRVHGPAAIDSIAVLPFESFGGDTANAYFAEGMADELATALGKVPGLRVAARTSSAAVSGMKLTVGQIGARLDVRAVITGTVRRAGDRMRVRAELASVATGLTMWDSTFDRGVSDVFALQDELTRTIVGAMRLTLTAASAPGTASDVRGTANLEAYDLYLRGMHFYNRRGASLSKAVEFLEQALARDPAFARAWAGLSLALSSVAVRDAAADSLGTRAEAAAQRAVMLDSTSSDAYTALGRAASLPP